MKPIQASLLVGVVILCSFTSLAAEKDAAGVPLDLKKIQLAHYAKAFIGPGNVTIEIAPYKIGDKDGAILLFKGVEGPWDGQAINHHIRPGAYRGKKYVTQVNGKEWITLSVAKERDGRITCDLYLPGSDEPESLAPSDGAAQNTTP